MSRQVRAGVILASLLAIVLSACSGGGSGSTPSPTPTAAASEEAEPSTEPSVAEPTATPAPNTGEANLDGPAEIEAGSEFEVAWTGPDNRGDYITIVPEGATEWTGGDDYFYTADGSPGDLTAPTKPGPYELWYVSGVDDSIATRVAITVTPFTGSLLAPEEVAGGTQFDVAWNGPDASGDYIAIVPVGATQWTGGDPYFYTANGNPGQLYAPMKGGDYEIWYVAGVDDSVQSRISITVLPPEISLDAPDQVKVGAQFQVTWSGPDGQSDYITIVPAGSAEGTYLSYAYTSAGSPATLTAPDDPGDYEIWYASDRVNGIFGRIPITVIP